MQRFAKIPVKAWRISKRWDPGRFATSVALLFSLWCLGAFAAQADDCPEDGAALEAPEVRVLTANLAHGRKEGVNQMLQREETTRRNLRDAAAILSAIDADVIALQEADGPSRWSGRFDHVRFVADRAGYGCVHHGLHARTSMFEFGTALLSRLPFTAAESHDFEPTPPSTTNGFVVARVPWMVEGQPGNELLTVVSVHLDFSRRSVRQRQFRRLTAELSRFQPPMVVMGDFNTTWDDDSGLLRRFARELELHTWKPGDPNYGTYSDGAKRLDWILITSDLRFADFQVRPETISDHSAVLAVIERVTGVAGRAGADTAAQMSPEG